MSAGESVQVEILEDWPPVRTWPSLRSAGGVFVGPKWQSLSPDRFGRLYVLRAHIGRRPVGVLPVTIVDREPDHPAYRTTALLGTTGAQRFPLMFLGSTASRVNGVPVAAELGPSECMAVRAALLDTARGLASRLGCYELVIPFVAPEAQDEFVGLTRSGARSFVTDQIAVLRLPGTEFDHYLASLRGRQARDVRKELRQFERYGLTSARIPLADAASLVAPLFAAHRSRHGSNVRADEIREKLDRRAAAAGADAMIFLAMHGDELVIASTVYQSAGRLWCYDTALDDRHSRPSCAYYVVAYYQPIAYAYECAIQVIDFGYGFHAPKLKRGAKLEPVTTWRIRLSPRLGSHG